MMPDTGRQQMPVDEPEDQTEYPEDLEREEDGVFEQDDSSEHPPSDIVSFNELRSCADLVRMHETNQLEIKPDFQRDIVWSNASQSRFIDSLTKQLPIPSMCISLDYKTGRRLMIDGLQRMWSIIQFLTNDKWKFSALDDIDPRIAGKRSEYVQQNYPDLYDRVENLTIPVTVLRCDYAKRKHKEYLFTIFHRLNAGGNKLTNQEIRNCIYSGTFNDLLGRCTASDHFRHLFGLEQGKSYRFVWEEFVLRVLAFTDDYQTYDGNLSRFLNNFMDAHRDDPSDNESFHLFERVVQVVYSKIADGQVLPKLSKATYEALFVGIARSIDLAEGKSAEGLRRQFEELREAEEFRVENLKNALTTRIKLIARLDQATMIFSEA